MNCCSSRVTTLRYLSLTVPLRGDTGVSLLSTGVVDVPFKGTGSEVTPDEDETDFVFPKLHKGQY